MTCVCVNGMFCGSLISLTPGASKIASRRVKKVWQSSYASDAISTSSLQWQVHAADGVQHKPHSPIRLNLSGGDVGFGSRRVRERVRETKEPAGKME